jgi:uncharacterized repeat protein (TIGR01451 family)
MRHHLTALLAALALAAAVFATQAAPAQAATASADVHLTASATPNPVLAGNSLTYTFTVANAGPNRSPDTRVGSWVPAGAVFQQVSASQGTCTAPAVGHRGLVVCQLGNLGHLATNNTATVTLVVQVLALDGNVVDTAQVITPASTDPNKADNIAVTTTTITPRVVDLGLAMSGPSTVTLGSNITYTLSVTNKGPNGALNPQLADWLPKGATFVSASTSQGTCGQVTVGGSSRVRCNLGRVRVGGVPATVTIVVQTTKAGKLANRALVRSKAVDANGDDNKAAVVTTVTGSGTPIFTDTDIGLQIFGQSPFAELQKTFEYHLSVGNGGPAAASGVSLNAQLPDSATLQSFTTDSGTCTGPAVGKTGTLHCTFGSIAASGGANVDLVVNVPQTTEPLLLTGALVQDPKLVDANPTDSTSSVLTKILDKIPPTHSADLAQADLSVTTTPTKGAALPTEVDHSIRVGNAGPDGATNVRTVVRFAKGTGLILGSITVSRGTLSLDSTGRVLTWKINNLPSGTSALLMVPASLTTSTLKANLFNLDVASRFGQSKPKVLKDASSVATVSSDAYDPDLSDNTTGTLVGPQVGSSTLSDLAAHCQDRWGSFGKQLGGADCTDPTGKLLTSMEALSTTGKANSSFALVDDIEIWNQLLASKVVQPIV